MSEVRGKAKLQLVPEPEQSPMGGFGSHPELMAIAREWDQNLDDEDDAGMTAWFEGAGEDE